MFVRNLRIGSSGDDVKQLQVFLNTNGFPISESGPGSINQETKMFGLKTWLAVQRYQLAHSVDILVPLNLTTPTGFFGLKTRTSVNNMLK